MPMNLSVTAEFTHCRSEHIIILKCMIFAVLCLMTPIHTRFDWSHHRHHRHNWQHRRP